MCRKSENKVNGSVLSKGTLDQVFVVIYLCLCEKNVQGEKRICEK